MVLRFAFALLITITSSMAYAQDGRVPPALKNFPKIKKADYIAVILDDRQDSPYNQAMRSAIEHYWDFLPVKFVTMSEMPLHAFEDGNAMLVRNNSTRLVQRVGRQDVIRSNDLAIYPTGKGTDLQYYTGYDAVARTKLPDVQDFESYLFKLGPIVGAMNRYLHFLDATEYTEDNLQRLLDANFNDLNWRLDTMRLLVVTEDLEEGEQSASSIARILKGYRHNITIAPRVEIADSVATGSAHMGVVHLDNRKQRVFVLRVSDGQIVYLNESAKRREFGRRDILAISKRADKAAKANRKSED